MVTTSVRRPRRAADKANPAERVVLPTPPPPVIRTMRVFTRPSRGQRFALLPRAAYAGQTGRESVGHPEGSGATAAVLRTAPCAARPLLWLARRPDVRCPQARRRGPEGPGSRRRRSS